MPGETFPTGVVGNIFNNRDMGAQKFLLSERLTMGWWGADTREFFTQSKCGKWHVRRMASVEEIILGQH
jgi:hypothetical protein